MKISCFIKQNLQNYEILKVLYLSRKWLKLVEIFMTIEFNSFE